MKMRYVPLLLTFSLFLSGLFYANAQEHGHSENKDAGASSNHEEGHEEEEHKKFDPASFIMHHISDDYRFQVIGDVYIPLPIILYVPGSGLSFHSLGSFTSENPEDHHAALVKDFDAKHKLVYHHGKLVVAELDSAGHIQHDSTGHAVGYHAAKITDVGSSHHFINFSITKNVFGILLSMTLLLLIFGTVARAYKKRAGLAPKGLQGAMEMLILFVQNDIAKPSIGEKKYRKFLPYLLTLFFFIWINNILGLIPIFPGSANVTGNTAITLTLAVISLFLVLLFGNRHFWAHILWPPGMPVPVKILVAVIEFVGVFTKVISLMIRLFANITAGHIIIMSIIGITFIIESYVVGVVTSLFSVVMFMLEMLVAAIQAYIFTLLTALMIGAAVEEPHHHHDAKTAHGH